ncbi:monocarboxylate transporter 12-like [Strongylocentrotus purpuratus]|uniref:Major facilitator superfamily (MFS) profile domain-containing protein n=1 Tax=Strongylocentrotus purpuratus TaxID=7668 RepID=A0A7M7HPJ7_STRPU|nr:monocarboxylate transporter 12-like [Strongylocentrotus purpuratus]|eukprot:XP_011679673.1 PREDICTED: monocarboxylate transporter 12-like [Strongylocentrotus purpuratus]
MANKFLVVLGCWLIQFLEVGTIKSFAVLLGHIVRDLESTTGRLGMYIGLYHAVTIMSGIVVKALLNRYSPRSLSMLGGLIGSLGLMICSEVTKPIYFAVCLFISGLGFSMAVLPSMVSVMYAFGDKYMLPFSVGLMGGGMGMMILPLLTQKLLEAYTWQGALLILGAINLHVVVSGALFEKAILQKESPPYQSDLQETPQTRDASYEQDSSTSDLHRVGNGDRVQHHASQSDSWLFRCSRRTVELFRAARQGAGMGVFSEYPIIMYALLAAYLHGVSYIGWTVFVISNAEAKGFDESIAVFLSLVAGIGNIIGRLMPGLLNYLNKDMFPSRNSFILFGIIGALPLCLNGIASRFSTLCVFATLNGLALGAKTIVKNTTVVDVVPPSLSSTVLPFAMICSGLGEITGGWMTGRIFDLTGSMDTSFLFLGCVDIFSVVVLLLSLLHGKIHHLRS